MELICFGVIVFIVWVLHSIRIGDEKERQVREDKLRPLWEAARDAWQDNKLDEVLTKEMLNAYGRYVSNQRLSDTEKQVQKIAIVNRVYKHRLACLREKNDPNVAASALKYGRQKARMYREGGNETIFDEVALQNDLAAATLR
ncbi:MAG: hypothetical protein ACPG8W_19475 [Candidatus Promineifilaceae bacterium]